MEETKDTRIRIIEAFSSDGCPLCAMLRRDELDSLYQWVGQSNNNAKNSARIKQLLDAGGFCNYHFWRFGEMSTHYGSANVGAQLIEKLLKTLRADKQIHPGNVLKHREKVSEAWFAECPLCFELREKEGGYIEELLVILKNQEGRLVYENSCGLCIPHYVKVINYIDDNSLMSLLYETQIRQLEKIKSDAESFISKRNPPKRWNQTEDEKISYFRAIEKISSRSGS
jgi:hypothetical protein